MSVDVSDIIAGQKAFFASGSTRPLTWRVAALKKLRDALYSEEAIFLEALKQDLGKPPAEAWSSEIGFVVREIDHALKHLSAWTRPRKVRPPLLFFPSNSRIVPEPKGVVLVIAPWNYPLQLLLAPLVGSIAAGNCAVLKPSELAAETSRALAAVIGRRFDPCEVSVAEGGADTAAELLAQEFDHVFFTGSARVGRIVMAAAAKKLTPVTLELGGKNPCIVDRDVDVAVAARRIAWGKYINAGQTCVAPDYLLVPPGLKKPVIDGLRRAIGEFYGADPRRSADYARIVNDGHFSRLADLLGEGKIVIGGGTDRSKRYVAPTVIDAISWKSRIMEEEIFGPILPVLEYDGIDRAIAEVNARPRPLALYFFSRDKWNQERMVRETSSGGVCVNDTILQILISALPFGGVGPSGMGSYHGKASFDTFTHHKSVMVRSFRPDFRQRYPPYRASLSVLKNITRWLE